MDLYLGEIHALVGQNGSGKSTFIKILSGYHGPDRGTVSVDGQSLQLPISRQHASASGLRFVHQNLGLDPRFTVLETIRVDRWQRKLAPIRWRTERVIVARLLASLGVDIDPDTEIRELTPSQQAVVAIARALDGIGEARSATLVLDEPTSSLGKSDSDRLFATLRQLRSLGHALLFISHRLDEVMALADRVTVIRDGERVLTAAADEVTHDTLITAILGRDLGDLYPPPLGNRGQAYLAVDGLAGGRVRGLSFDVAQGEIVGITGSGGMGQDDVPALIYGALAKKSGSVHLQGQELEELNPRRAMAAGMAYLPADRQTSGGVMRATVAENVTMATVGDFYRGGRLRHRSEAMMVSELLRRFEIRPPRPDLLLAALSGGNQQKVLLAKWLQTPRQVLLLHEPTQGIDIGSKQQVFKIINEAASGGAAVIIASSEHADLAHICNRVIVMVRGSIASELRPPLLTEAHIVRACYTAPEIEVAA